MSPRVMTKAVILLWIILTAISFISCLYSFKLGVLTSLWVAPCVAIPEAVIIILFFFWEPLVGDPLKKLFSKENR
jgi:hypothetical protein